MSFLLSPLAPAGSTTAQNYPSQSFHSAVTALALLVRITAGAGTLTFKFQGSIRNNDVLDANDDWFDLAVSPSASSPLTTVATDTKTVVGASAYFVSIMFSPIRKIRLVVSTATTVTFDATLGVITPT